MYAASEREYITAGEGLVAYLGVVFTSDGRGNEEIDIRVGKANAVLREAYRSVFTKRKLSTRTVARRSSIGGIYIFARRLVLLK